MKVWSAALLALVLPFAVQSQPVEQVLDNVAPAFSAGANWAASTAVSGYVGANYQARAPGLLGPTSIVVDNTDAGFSVTGTWPVSTSVGGYLGANYSLHSANGDSPAAIVVDNSAGTVTGTWPVSTSVSGYIGTNYQVHTAGTGTNVFTWPFTLAAAGQYQVYARWTQHPNRATNAQYTVNHGSGSSTVAVNQEAGGGTWHLLGTWGFNAGAGSVSLSDAANEYVVADAIKIVPENAPPNTATWTLVVPETKSYRVYARWTAHPNRATDAQYTVNHSSGSSTVAANQEAGSGVWNLLGTWSFNAGNATVTLNDQANGYVIADAIRMDPTDAIPDVATWTPTLTQPTKFEVYARWTANANRASDAAYTVTHSTGTSTVTANQQANGGAWNLLGTYIFNPGHKVQLAGDGNGYVIADAVRLVPAVDQPSAGVLYFVHPDHLNTPRLIADGSQTTVWRNDQAEPFGSSTPNGDPNNTGSVFEMPLRFPGQYFDRETNLSYNYFRHYDSSIGRYSQSDPIGLGGGNNTFGYGFASPLRYSDPNGLFAFLIPGLVSGGIGGTVAVVGYVAGRLAFDCPIEIKGLLLSAGFGFTAGALLPYIGTSAAGAIGIGALAGGGQEVASELLDGSSLSNLDSTKIAVNAAIGAIGGGIGGAYKPMLPFGRSATALPDAVDLSNAVRNVNANKPGALGLGIGAGTSASSEISNVIVDRSKGAPCGSQVGSCKGN